MQNHSSCVQPSAVARNIVDMKSLNCEKLVLKVVIRQQVAINLKTPCDSIKLTKSVVDSEAARK